MHENKVNDDTIAIEMNPISSQMPIGSGCELVKGTLPTTRERQETRK